MPDEAVEIEVRYDGGIAQAYHPESGVKQLGETPGEAVDELWRLLEGVE